MWTNLPRLLTIRVKMTPRTKVSGHTRTGAPTGWEKVRLGGTLRGHTPIAHWMNKISDTDFGDVEVYKMTSGKGKGNYFVEVWSNGKFNKYSPSYQSKSKALAFATDWMRRHPNG